MGSGDDEEDCYVNFIDVVKSGQATTPRDGPDQGGQVVTETLILSPFQGTAYLGPSPGGKPFVEVGQTVQAGQQVCMVEMMKMHNAINADRAGTISAVLVQEGQTVSKNQVLFRVRPLLA
ncbi:MAG: hypothetical protein PHI73_00050 [Patescibacteria group bacterium]|nr:hypothetical protein [Patescibacteria group bacterium]